MFYDTAINCPGFTETSIDFHISECVEEGTFYEQSAFSGVKAEQAYFTSIVYWR